MPANGAAKLAKRNKIACMLYNFHAFSPVGRATVKCKLFIIITNFHFWSIRKFILLSFAVKQHSNSLKSLWTWLENRETRWIEVVGFPLNARFFRKLSWSCSVSYLGQSDSHPPSIHLDVFTHVTFEGIWIQLEWHTLDSEIVTVWPKNQKPNLKYCKPSYFNF